MTPELYTLIGALGSGLLLGVANIIANWRKNKAEAAHIEAETERGWHDSNKDQAEATALITQAASSIIEQLQGNAKIAQDQFHQVSMLLEATKQDLKDTRNELAQARNELRLLRNEVGQLREYVKHLGGDPDNPPPNLGFGFPPMPPEVP